MSLSKSQILEAQDLDRKEVGVSEWGGTVFVRMLTGRQRDAFEAQQEKDPYTDLRARLAVATVCDEAGNLLFSEADIPALTNKNGKALDRVFAAAVKFNGIAPADIEELRKNS
jgi:hypothetical protein